MDAAIGDKVRLKEGPHRGGRGVVEDVEHGGTLLIRLEQSARAVRVAPTDVTNFSLAARKAWVTGPDRPVGRRKGTKLCDRISVTLRIDRDMWEHFRSLEQAGVIADRTALINRLLREQLDTLTKKQERRH